MGPREEDNGMLLLGAVALICGLIAFAPWLLEPSPAMAGKTPERLSLQTPAESHEATPARVIVPFTPNTTPAQR